MKQTRGRPMVFILASFGLLALVIGILATQPGHAAEPWYERTVRQPSHRIFEASPLQPEITVAPLVLSATLGLGEESTRTLTLSNGGGLDLFWALAEHPEVIWLAEEPVSGTVTPDDIATI